MRAVDIIAKKRDGRELTRDEIGFVISGYTAGNVADYQMSALLMAIFLRGMTPDETFALTDAMLHSGEVIDLSHLGRPCIDKHSTGGVGDKTSLVIAPVVAAAGVLVPMMSGRALGHSGGTLDKLESIPGFKTNLTLAEFKDTLEKVGVALIGQTAEIAPADKKLYALRDVTATVACRPLMAASIMSKKMAEGARGLVLDVKTGSGAFLKLEEEARALATTMMSIAQSLNKDCVALITDMNQPLGRAVGNANELVEALQTLKGRGPEDLNLLCRELSAEMLVLGNAATDIEKARTLYDQLISSGAAIEKFRQIIEAQGGNPSVIDDYKLLPTAAQERQITSSNSGYVRSIDTEAIGHAVMLLGAGRTRLDTPIDLGVGLTIRAGIGDQVKPDSTLVTIHFNDASGVDEASQIISDAYQLSSEPVKPPALIKAVLR